MSKKYIKPVGREKQRQNRKDGIALRKDIIAKRLNGFDECGISTPIVAAALRNIAYPKTKKQFIEENDTDKVFNDYVFEVVHQSVLNLK